MSDNKWKALVRWLWQEYKKSVRLGSLEGGKGYRKFLDGLDADYPGGGRLHQHYFLYLRYLWPIASAGYTYYRFEMVTATRFTYAYVLVDEHNRPEYVCTSPTYDSKDGEYRRRLISFVDFEETYSRTEQPLSGIEKPLLEMIARGALEINVTVFPETATPSPEIENLRLPIKCAAVAVFLDLGGWMQPHVAPNYSSGIRGLAEANPAFRNLGALLGANSAAWNAFDSGRPPRDTTVACGSKLIPLTLREVMSPWDVTYTAWREMTVKEYASDLVLNVVCPSFAFVNQWTYLDGARGGLFENPNVQNRYRRGSVASESVRQLREGRQVIQPEIKESNAAADFDAHVYESIEYAQGFLLMSEEVLYTTEEYVGFTLATLPTAIARYPYPHPEYTRLVTSFDHFAKLVFDYLYGAHCLHTKLGVVHSDEHANNLTVYRCGATHRAVHRDGKAEFVPFAESPLVAYVAGPRGEADTFVFPFTGTNGCIIDFSRSLIGPGGSIYADLVKDKGATHAHNFMRDQANRVLRALHRGAPSFVEKAQEPLKAAILANPAAVFRALSYTDFTMVGKSLGTMLASKFDPRFTPPPELRAFARRIETLSRDALVTYLTDLKESKGAVEAGRIPFAGESLLPKLFADYRYQAWSAADLRGGALVDAFNFNNPVEWSGSDYELFPPWARLDKLEEHMGEVKITDMFPRGIRPFLESLLPSPRVSVIAEAVRADQDALDMPAGPTSSWIESSAAPIPAEGENAE